MNMYAAVLLAACVTLLGAPAVTAGGTTPDEVLLSPYGDSPLGHRGLPGTTWVRVHLPGLSPCAPEDTANSHPLQTTEHVWCFEGAGGDSTWPNSPPAAYDHWSRYAGPVPIASGWHVTTLHGGSGTGTYNAWAGCDVVESSPGCEEVSYWINPGGYANGWNNALTLDCSGQDASQGGQVAFDLRYDSECLYDYLYVERFDDTTFTWRLLEDAVGNEAVFNGVSGVFGSPCGVDYFGHDGTMHGSGSWVSASFPFPPVNDLKIRWRIYSDPSVSDQDGLIDTDGLAAIDNVLVSFTASGDLVSDDFETGDFTGVFASSGTASWLGLYSPYDAWHLEFDPNYSNKGNTPTFSNDWMWAAKPAGSPMLANGFDFFLAAPVINVQDWLFGVVEYSQYYCFPTLREDFGQEVVRIFDSITSQWSAWYPPDPPLSGGCTEWWMNRQLSLTPFLGSNIESLQVGWEVWDASEPGDISWGKHGAVQFLVDNVSFGFHRADLVDAPEALDGAAVLEARPNPFRDRTEITFSTPVTGEIDLSIYDVRGGLVRRLASGRQPAGTHSAVWDGRDDGGGLVPSGVYFYRLKADRDIRSGKLVLFRSREQ